MLFVLRNVWLEFKDRWASEWRGISPSMNFLADSFENMTNDPNVSRDILRDIFHSYDPESSPRGKSGVVLEDLTIALPDSDENDSPTYLSCKRCGATIRTLLFCLPRLMVPMQPDNNVMPDSIAHQLLLRLNDMWICKECLHNFHSGHFFIEILQTCY